ncbi:bacteriophage Gp15 family protein [Pediococcus acidilactici]
MKLLEAVQDLVEVEGVKYDCNVSVPAVFLYFELMQDDGLIEAEKIDVAYRMLVKPGSQIEQPAVKKR